MRKSASEYSFCYFFIDPDPRFALQDIAKSFTTFKYFSCLPILMITLIEEIAIGIAILAALYFLFRPQKRPEDPEFRRIYKEILTSDKYKVKGRFEE